ITQIWDVKTGTKVSELTPEDWEMQSLCMRFAPDSKSLMTLNGTSYARRWNAQTGAIEKEFFAAETPANPSRIHWTSGAAIARDFGTAVSSEKRSISIWKARLGQLASTIQMPEGDPKRYFHDLAISSDASLVAAVDTVNAPDGRGDSVIRIFDLGSGRELQTF